MKRSLTRVLGLRVLPTLMVLALSSCFLMGPDYGDWNGKMEGTEGLYLLELTQSGKDLVFTVSLDTAKYAEASQAKGFYPPEELFFWIAPTFRDDDSSKGVSWLPHQMYPVGRQLIREGFLEGTASIEVRVNLEGLANDWNRWWLQPYQLDGDDGMGSGDDMNGVYALVADNYGRDDGWGEPSTLSLDEGDAASFQFNSSRPMGIGYSNTAARLEDDWLPVVLTSEGLWISTANIYGGTLFELRLKLPENAPLGSDTIPLDGTSYTVQLGSVNAYSEEGTEYAWRIQLEPQDYSGVDGEFIDGVIHLIAPPIGWYQLNYRWYWVHFNYRGFPRNLFQTDFSSDYALDGELGSGQYLERDPEADNNWGIAEVGSLPVQPGMRVEGKVLGLGAGGNPALNYGPNREDSIILPAVDYWSLFYNEDGSLKNPYSPTEVHLTFDLYKNLDKDWSDVFSIEIERFYWQWNGEDYEVVSYWEPVESWYDSRQAFDNNGWVQHTTRIESYYFTVMDVWSSIYVPQEHRIRLHFRSNGWNHAEGVYIDNLAVRIVE